MKSVQPGTANRSTGPVTSFESRTNTVAGVSATSTQWPAAPLRVLVRQIAGLIARRIITYSREGERVQQGERMGLIRFGSRVDVYLPTTAAVRVTLGELTSAGTTVLAELPSGDG